MKAFILIPAITLMTACYAENHVNYHRNGVKKMLYQQNIININQDDVESIQLYVVDAIVADWHPNAEQIKKSVGKIEGYQQGREVGYYVIKPEDFHLFIKKLNNSKVIPSNKKFTSYRLLIEIHLKNGESVNILSSDNSSEAGFFDGSVEKNGIFYYVLFDSTDMTELFKQANENKLIFNQ